MGTGNEKGSTKKRQTKVVKAKKITMDDLVKEREDLNKRLAKAAYAGDWTAHKQLNEQLENVQNYIVAMEEANTEKCKSIGDMILRGIGLVGFLGIAGYSTVKANEIDQSNEIPNNREARRNVERFNLMKLLN